MTKAQRNTKIILALLISLVMMLSIGEGIFGARLVATADDDPVVVEGSTEENGEPNVTNPEDSDSTGGTEEPDVNDLEFKDVATSEWYYDAVLYVFDNELMEGSYNPGEEPNFAPSDSFTRAQAAMIFYRYAVTPDVSEMPNPFSDVLENVWYTDAIKWAASDGIVQGHPDGTYGPNDPLTKEQLAAIVSRWQIARDLIAPDVVDSVIWPDFNSIREYAQEPVTQLTAQGVFQDIPGANFRPQDNATRAEIASVLYRLLSAIDKTVDAGGEPAEVDSGEPVADAPADGRGEPVSGE